MSTQTIATLRNRLKGFVDADTNSQAEGFLLPGKYAVLEVRENHPNDDTDYARVRAPELGAGDTWICTRWQDQRYADIQVVESPGAERQAFDDAPQAVPEEVLIGLLDAFHNFTYDLDEARYPYALPGVRVPQAPPTSNNCCTFVEALVVKAWTDAHASISWDTDRHGQMMIFSKDDYFSPVTAVVDSGMGVAVPDDDAAPHPWTLVQGWRRQWEKGHTFLIVDHHEPTDRVLTLESNSSYQLNGVGFRAIGNLRDVGGTPPDEWWERDDLWTWERIQSTYRFRRQAWLKVKERSWSGL